MATLAHSQEIPSSDLAMWAGVFTGIYISHEDSTLKPDNLQTIVGVSNAKNRLDIDSWGLGQQNTNKKRYRYKLNYDGFVGYSLIVNFFDEETKTQTIKMAKFGYENNRECQYLLTLSGTANEWSISKEVR